MLPLLVAGALLAFGVVVLSFHGAALYFAARMPRLDPEPSGDERALPTVTAIVAARNEEEDLPGCLDDLAAQRYPNLGIVVVDGASTDGTREAVKARSDRVRLLDEPPLPSGWVGKNWALHEGARESSSEWILFTDADVRYDPRAVASTVRWAMREGADLASLAPRVAMRGFWENLILPFYVQMVLTYFRAPRVNRDRSRAAMANGQYLLVRRSAYDAIGGHAAVRTAVLEDVALARRFRARGFRLRIGWSPGLITTRMYRSRPEMFEGLLKNVHDERFSAARQLGFLAALVALFWAPFAILPIGVAGGSLPVALFGAFVAGALLAKHVVFTRAVRGRAVYGLLFPLAVGYYLVVVATSLSRGLRRRPIVWKGREYALETDRGRAPRHH
ncbi:MAG TPA: glycosyltransferase family 2 protein [Thermoplasmata archaeon]|nr:glycosyltransferase family 2 protein [Thermoplasmata archaeon]